MSRKPPFPVVDSPYLVPDDGSFRVARSRTAPPKGAADDEAQKALLKQHVEALDDLQKILYAHDRHSVLLVFQAMDAAGKDSTIRAVLTGINPAGCEVHSFKRPTPKELDHDFLWRATQKLPERGRIGVFNRSYYEEVLVVKVHPEWIGAQRLPPGRHPKRFWKHRYESIRDHERHLARNGTVILKFWLHVSREEQRRRFLSRLDEPEKNWKFEAADVAERQHWDAYMDAYEDALNATSRDHAPWYAIPADSKPYMRATVAGIIVERLRQLDLHYPTVDPEAAARYVALRKQLVEE